LIAGVRLPTEATAAGKSNLVPQPSKVPQDSAQPLGSSPTTRAFSNIFNSASTPFAALDLNSPTSSAKKRKLAKATNDDQREPSPSPVPKPSSSKRIALEVPSLPASTAPNPMMQKDKIEAQVVLSKIASTQAPRPPPVLKTLSTRPIPLGTARKATPQSSTSVKSEWDLVCVRSSFSLHFPLSKRF